MAKIRKIYDDTIKPDGSKVAVYPVTVTRAVFSPDGERLDDILARLPVSLPYVALNDISELPRTETDNGYLIGENLYVWVGSGGNILEGLYQNCGKFRGPAGTVTNFPDEEDLTSVDGRLRLADRNNLNGKGYVILRRGTTLSEQITEDNTIYEIRYDFNLGGNSIEIPIGSVLKFNGGSLSNGTITGNDTVIDADLVKIFGDNLVFAGSFAAEEVYPEWFGTDSEDESPFINSAITACGYTTGRTVKLSGRIYNIRNTISIGITCSLIGTDIKKYTTSGTDLVWSTINVIGNIDGITYYTDSGYQHNRQIKNLYIQKDGSDKANKGIYVKGNSTSVRMQMLNWEVNNVTCTGFEYGFYIEGMGFYGISDNQFIKCAFTYNKIGLAIICTDTGEGSQKSAWVNQNEYTNCRINNNTIGGVVFSNVDSQENNFFNNCLFESNGAGYSASDIGNFDNIGFAFKLTSHRTVGYGVVYFNGCYFENNYPRRSNANSDLTVDEYEYNGNYFPNNIESISSMIICERGNVNLENNKLSGHVTYGKYTRSGLHMYMNDWQYSISYMASPTIDYLIDYGISLSYTKYQYLYINENTYPRESFTKKLLNITPASQGTEIKDLDIFIHHFTLPCDVISGGGFWRYNAYLGGTGKNSSNLGLLPNAPLYDMSYLWKAFAYNDSPEYTCYVQDVNFGIALGPNYVYKKINFVGKTTGAALKSGSKHIELYGDATFSRLLIELVDSSQSPDSTFAIAAAGAKRIEFINCTITIPSTARHLISSSTPVEVIFKNCTFTFGYVGSNPFTAVKQQNATLKFVNCTFPNGVTVEEQPTSGTTRPYLSSDAQAGIYFFDETLHKPIWSNGSGGWVDATGTSV